MRTLRENFSSHIILFVLLSLSGLAFFFKGSIYLLIGSWVPFLLSLIFLFLIVFVLTRSNRTARRIIRLFGILLILWGVSRLTIELMFAFADLTEAHIQEQFTIYGKAISMIAIFIGAYSWRYAKKYVVLGK